MYYRGFLDVRLWDMYSGAQSVPPFDVVNFPWQASYWGLARVLGLEHPFLLGGIVDLEPFDSTSVAAEKLWSLMKLETNEDQFAVRSGRCYVPREVSEG